MIPHHHHHIDIGTVLRGAVCSLYSNLVTRPTGAAVRTEIERVIAEVGGRTVTVIDFAQVTLLDFSCADEIVAKLMLKWCAPLPADAVGEALVQHGTAAGYFVFRNLRDHHLDAVEAVLERHGLAIVALIDGRAQIVGEVDAAERAAWEALHGVAPADAAALAACLAATAGSPDDVAGCAALLERLARRRLVMPASDGRWLPVGLAAALAAADGAIHPTRAS